MYEVFLSDLAKRQLKKLPQDLRVRIIVVLKRCRIRPHTYVKKIVSCLYYSLRVGDYRIILDIKDKNLKILVIKMGYRKKIYKYL